VKAASVPRQADRAVEAGITRRDVVRFRAAGGAAHGADDHREESDEFAVEEPLEIRIAGEAVAVTMRTPGHDRELAAGFLFAEGILRATDDIGSIVPCGRPGEEGYGNVIDVIPGAGISLDVERIGLSKRGTLTTASCGVCGRRSIDDLLANAPPIDEDVSVSAGRIAGLEKAMRAAQQNFARTGGLHAAAIFDAEGENTTPRVIFEDIGRHNAVDKAIGQLLLSRRLPATRSVLIVSGRASFEIVQKAIMARIAVLASVSAASSLAVDLAHRTRVTLMAFVRGDAMTVCTGSERVTP
jgi:FdhD protein